MFLDLARRISRHGCAACALASSIGLIEAFFYGLVFRRVVGDWGVADHVATDYASAKHLLISAVAAIGLMDWGAYLFARH